MSMFKFTLRKKIAVLGFALAISASCFSETEGERLFKTNNPSAAAVALEKEIAEGNETKDSYNFLALSYFQCGNYTKSIDAFERGLKSPRANKKLLCLNEGNVAYSKGDYSKAESCFSLALVVSKDFYPALLNRANTYLVIQDYRKAREDYVSYVEALPDDSQADNIRRLIAYLDEQIVFQAEEEKRMAEEAARIAEENERIQAELQKREEERLAAEKQAREAEAERRRKLLEDVANSLQQTDSMNMTAGAEDVLDYEYESELD